MVYGGPNFLEFRNINSQRLSYGQVRINWAYHSNPPYLEIYKMRKSRKKKVNKKNGNFQKSSSNPKKLYFTFCEMSST